MACDRGFHTEVSAFRVFFYGGLNSFDKGDTEACSLSGCRGLARNPTSRARHPEPQVPEPEASPKGPCSQIDIHSLQSTQIGTTLRPKYQNPIGWKCAEFRVRGLVLGVYYTLGVLGGPGAGAGVEDPKP